MLQAFTDDSTSNVGDQMFFLAGYINTVEMWEAFSTVWDAALKAHPPIEYLKMTEAEALRGEFAGWSREDRDKKVLLLAEVIRISAPHFFFCRVSRKDYVEILAPHAPYNLKSPYFAAWWGVIDTVARYCQNDGNNLPVDFVFDEQGGTGDDAVLFYRWQKDNLEPALRAVLGATPIFRDDKRVLPLQAADMLAWHLRRHHERSGDEERPVYQLITERGVGREIERKHLTVLARQMKRVPGVKYVQTKADWRQTRRSTVAQLQAGYGPPSTNPIWMLYVEIRYRLSAWWKNSRRPKRPRG